MKFTFTYVSPSIERLQGWSSKEYKLGPKKVLTPASLNRVLDEFNRQYELGRGPALARSSTLNSNCSAGRINGWG
jgi:hypothetical protein